MNGKFNIAIEDVWVELISYIAIDFDIDYAMAFIALSKSRFIFLVNAFLISVMM